MKKKQIIIKDEREVSLPLHKRLIENWLGKNPKITKSILRALGRQRASLVPDYIKIETTNACNGNCIYCPRAKMSRPLGFMDEALFKKIAQDIKKSGINCVHLQNYGEPLLDQGIFEKISLLKKQGIKSVCIFTNGLLLSEEVSHRLIESGLDEIGISIDTDIESVHDRTRKNLNFKDMLNNIQRLLELRGNLGRRLKITLCATVHEHNRDGIISFRDRWKVLVDEIHFQNAHGWSQNRNYLVRDNFPCQRLWLTFTVLWDGRVSLCCVDFDGKLILGDLTRESILEVWNNRRYEELRRAHLSLDKNCLPAICSNCDLWLKDSPLWIRKLFKL